MLTPSQRQRRRREAGSEGSPRQNPAPRNTNRVEGEATRVSRQDTVKPVTTKGSQGKRGGGRGKVIVLIRGGLLGSPEMPGQCVRRVEVDGRARKSAVHRGEVSRGHSTGGEEAQPREGPNTRAEGPLAFLWERR